MSNTKEGGKKSAATNKAKYGKEYYAVIGAMGGKAKNKNKGFGSSHERAVEAGRAGGLKSRRYKVL